MLNTLRQYLRYTSWPIIAAMVALIGVGLTAIRVAETVEPWLAGHVVRQSIYAAAGLVGFVLMTVIPYRRVGQASYFLFAGMLGVLVLVLFLPARRGSHGWIELGMFSIQPSEFAKLAYIILLAWYLKTGDHYRRLSGLFMPFLLTFIPLGLILVEPDLGTCMLLLPTLYFMLLMAGAKLRHLLGIAALGTAVLFMPVPVPVTAATRDLSDRQALAYGSVHVAGKEYLVLAAPLAAMEHHQIRRIEGWLRQGDPTIVNDAGFQLHKAKMVLGGGMWSGHGDWQDGEAVLPLLPDDHTDFIFSVVGGRWGFLGGLFVLGLYGVIVVFGIEIASITKDPFGRLLAVGLLGMLFSQVCINVGMALGLMPITGMTLPMVSYGGSSLVVNCMALGLLVNVGQRRPIDLGKRPFEFGQRKEKPPAPYGPLAPGEY